MLYFISAWYNNNTFKENSQQWYQRRLSSEVDDSVKQLQLFNRNKISDTCAIILNHAPNYRHFLHRQGLLNSHYFNIFDSIQNISGKKAAVFSYRDLVWPKDIEFIYSPFCIIAYLDNKKYAQIEFGEDGNMILVDIFRDDKLYRRNIYDDRGFLSLTIVYKDGKMAYEQYLNDKGIWMICIYNDGHVLVNDKVNAYLIDGVSYNYKKKEYLNIDELIKEILSTYLKNINSDDIFVVAMHKLHSKLLYESLNDKRIVLSLFKDRCFIDDEYSISLCSISKAIVVDSKDTYFKSGLSKFDYKNKVTDITPFDTRVDFGISRQLKEVNILLSSDLLNDETFEKCIVILMEYMLNNKDARTNLFTRNSAYDIEDKLLTRVQNILVKNGYSKDYATIKKDIKMENDLDEELPCLFSVQQCINELSLSKCLRKQRLVIDLSDETDLFLQIGSISMGIPLIVSRRSDYVENGENGFVLVNLDRLSDVLKYYLDTLDNWNKAMIASYKIGKKFSSDNLVKWWKGVIDYASKD